MTQPILSFDERLGKLLYHQRLAAERSKHDVAAAVSISPERLDDIEKGRTPISANLLDRLGAALGIPAAIFMVEAEHRGSESGGACRELLTSVRGQQAVRAMVTCDRPAILDAVFGILIASSVRQVDSTDETVGRGRSGRYRPDLDRAR